MRSSLLLTLVLSACATAVPPSANDNPDAKSSDPATPDARASDPDGPTVAHPDAPSSACAYAGELASYSFIGQPGSQTSTAAASTATGVTAGELARASSLTATAGSGSINASNWAMTAQLDTTKYYSLTLTAPAGCQLHVDSIAIDAKSSGTGPSSGAIATSADAFAQTAAVSTTAPSTPSLTAVGGTLEVRVYGFAATGAGGTMRLQNTLSVTGSLQ